ncbi:MAG: hypothetical protein LBH30_00825 [Prevotellaceae bacterium]|jgi:hypothetical protein|nr:hypothetical protein [Prevotellaceae bacterium]
MNHRYKKNNDAFYEVQRNKIIIPFLVFAVVLIFMFKYKYDTTAEFSFLEIVVWSAVALLIIVFVCCISMKTVINSEGIYVKMFPFNRKYQYFTWDEIQKAYIRKYRPLVEYGGWGCRNTFKFRLSFITRIRYCLNSKKLFSKQNSEVMSISGNKGLQIEFTDGSKLLIGTHKSEELTEILKKLGKFNE